EGQVDAGLFRLVPERHERGSNGGVHDDRTAARIGGAVEGAQPHLDTGALVVGGSGAAVAGAVGAGQGRRRLREGGDVHAALSAAGAFGDLPDVATRCDGGPAAVRAGRCPDSRGDILGRHRGRGRVRLGPRAGAARIGHGRACVLLVDVFGVGDALVHGYDAGALVPERERPGGLGDSGPG